MIEKIKAVQNEFSSAGPTKVTTLGFKDSKEGKDYILGVFYVGPGMTDRAEIDSASCERTIDCMVSARAAYERAL